MTVSIESLTERFGPALDVPKLGKCLAIPGSEFDPDWEVLLGDQGFEVIFETWDNHPMTVVPLKIHGNEVKKVEAVPVKVEGADVLVDLVNNYQILSEGYESLSKAYVELRTKFEDLTADIEKKQENTIKWVVENYAESEELDAIQKQLAGHEHSEKSGKAMMPLEAS